MSSNNYEAPEKLVIDEMEMATEQEPSPSLSCYLNSQLEVLHMGEDFKSVFAIQDTQVLHGPLSGVLDEHCYAAVKPHIENALKGKIGHQLLRTKPQQNSVEMNFMFLPKPVLATSEDLPADEARGCYIIGQPEHAELVKARKTLDTLHKKLLEHEKLAVLGALVPGISHELNTPIGICMTGVSKLQMENNEILAAFSDGSLTGDKLEKYLKNSKIVLNLAETNLRRSADLVQSFKKVGVSQSNDQEVVSDIHTLLHDTVAALKPKYDRENAKVTFEIEAEQGLKAKTYSGLIFQVISNLIINSYLHGFEGQPLDGEIFKICISADVRDNELNIRYQDNGIGLSASAKKSIFEPFFTTDTTGIGSGLGMSIVHNIITEKLAGKINVDSTVTSGFALDLSIPVKHS